MRKTLLRLSISALLLIIVFTSMTNVSDVWNDLARVTWPYALAALALVAADRTLMTYKWLLLLASVNRGIPLARGLMIYCSATLLGSALPVTVGGDVIRGVFATRTGIGGEHVIASIVIERVIGFLACMLLGLSSLAYLRYTEALGHRFDPLLWLAMLVFCGGAALAIMSFSANSARKLEGWLPKRLRDSFMVRKLSTVLGAYRELGTKRSTLFVFTLLTLIEQCLPIALTYALAAGMGANISPLWLFCALTVSLIISRLPISVDGLGVFEGIFAGLLSLAQVPAHISVALAFGGRIAQLLVCLPFWLWLSMRYGITGATLKPASASHPSSPPSRS
jgi:uncharacterized protein (TIRG00374 family)